MTEAKWIWLDPAVYPDRQKARYSVFCDADDSKFTVAEFRSAFRLAGAVKNAHIDVFGDTKFWLYEGGRFVGMGPVCPGGDFGIKECPDKQYMNRYDIRPAGEEIDFFARVQLSPVVMNDFSCGQGGFYLRCEVEYESGEREVFVTDEGWQARFNGSFVDAVTVDACVTPDPWRQAAVVQPVWNVHSAPIDMLEETVIRLSDPVEIIAGAEETEKQIGFSRIYGAYTSLKIETDGLCEVTVESWEIPEQKGRVETIRTDHDMDYRGLRMMSTGGMTIRAKNLAGGKTRVFDVGLIFACYPVKTEGSFRCSDEEINRIYDVSKWTLQICRQWIHLDSTHHQEPLGCTGDYFVESMMTYFTFGDPSLVRFDCVRTADWLKQKDGVMFHTSYSQIWVKMLLECWRFTGDIGLLRECEEALHILMDRFNGYIGENGLIEKAPNYMFIDWRFVDTFTMHHPPKALGQTSLIGFYHYGLQAAIEICRALGNGERAQVYEARAKALREATNRLLFDEEKGLYMDGLNTPGDVNQWQPENTDKRYYTRHSSTLAVLSGICEGETAKRVMENVMTDDTLVDFQPYFAHFVLDALHQTGLFEKYGMKLIERWKPVIAACSKGMQEGWYSPGGGYGFDHSHAWGGTPAYQLPCRLMGFEMAEPGFRKIRLKPSLMGLDWAEIEMPTPYGMIVCRMEKGKEAQIEVPQEIEVVS